ncbi:hypothetical protein EDB19DRAFT_1827152 [Suillus lakei]|nr:hypothetical protein EDB19DRAFT_1827152 [Suillus lakei]
MVAAVLPSERGDLSLARILRQFTVRLSSGISVGVYIGKSIPYAVSLRDWNYDSATNQATPGDPFLSAEQHCGLSLSYSDQPSALSSGSGVVSSVQFGLTFGVTSAQFKREILTDFDKESYWKNVLLVQLILLVVGSGTVIVTTAVLTTRPSVSPVADWMQPASFRALVSAFAFTLYHPEERQSCYDTGFAYCTYSAPSLSMVMNVQNLGCTT